MSVWATAAVGMVGALVLVVGGCPDPAPAANDVAGDVQAQDPGPSTDAADGAKQDLGADVATDVGADVQSDPGPDTAVDIGADTGAGPRALLVDYDLRPASTWTSVTEGLSDAGYAVDYRRFYPHITMADATDYDVIAVGGGGAPSVPAVRMRADVEDILESFVYNGGALLMFPHRGWSDRVLGDSAWLHLNRVLERVGASIRFERTTMVGASLTGEDGKPPLHLPTLTAWPGSLEWALDPPVGYVNSEHAALSAAGVPFSMALGWVPLVSCDGDNVALLATTWLDALIWVDHSETNVLVSPAGDVVAALEPVSGGLVAVVPRSTATLGHSFMMSDKPVNNLAALDSAGSFVRAVLAHVAAIQVDPAAHTPTGCSRGLLPLTSASAVGLPALNPARSENAGYPPNTQPTPLQPVQTPAWAQVQPAQPSAVVEPEWFTDGKARLGYGDMSTAPWVLPHMALHGMNAAVLYVDSNFLQGVSEAPADWVVAADLAQTHGIQLYLGVHLANSAFNSLSSVAAGPLGAELGAPSGADPALWTDVVGPLLSQAATVAAAHPGIAGISLDLELYGANRLWYEDGYAFDDLSWAAVVDGFELLSPEVAAEAASVAAAQRMRWLLDRGLLGTAYYTLEVSVGQMANEVLEQARAINPELEVMLYSPLLADTWFYRALMRAWGQPQRPLVILTYDYATTPVADALRAENYSVRIVSGLLGVMFQPSHFQSALFNAAMRSDGYWLFALQDFPATDDPAFTATKHAPASEYWSAIDKVHQSLGFANP